MSKRGVNKVILLGRLGANPDVRYKGNGDPIANLSLATSEFWKTDDSNQRIEKTEWHKVVLFGKLAEVAAEYLRKGSQVYIEGKLKTRKWKTDNGQDRYATEVIVDIDGQMHMLGGGNQDVQATQNQQRSHDDSNTANNFDDDVPF